MTPKELKYSIDNYFAPELLRQLPLYVFWKDSDCTYLGCNDAFARGVGLSCPEDVIGKNDFDLPTAKEESIAYQTDDKEVMLTGQPKLNIEETQTFPDGRKLILLTNKVPLKNKKGKIIGVLGIYSDITERKKREYNMLEKAYYPGIALSKRQSQCLYYLLRGKSAASIAKILNLSPKTVEYYIEEVKNKMVCKNKSEIIEKAFEKGYINIVPAEII